MKGGFPTMAIILVIYVFWITVITNAQSRTGGSLLVETTTGTVHGIRRHVLQHETTAFLGIPFAEPPTGRQRFKPPIPKQPWEGILNATKLKRDCRQYIDRKYPGFHGAELWNVYNQSEDCLFLNIWVPDHRAGEKLPVMVWIYGGGFYSGGISLEVYDGATLAAEEGVVVVSINYRVSLFGFLALGHSDAPGNVGLLDQSLALQWISENIANFSGDDQRITIFGESAGSASVTYHIMSQQSRPFFHRAILQSGSSLSPWALIDIDEAIVRGLQMARDVGCYRLEPRGPKPGRSEMGDIISCLREKDPQDLLGAEWVVSSCFRFPFVPIVDGFYVTESPLAFLNRRERDGIDIMAGENSNEGSFFMVYSLEGFHRDTDSLINRTLFQRVIREAFPELNSFSHDAIEFMYTDWLHPNDEVILRDNTEHAVGDRSVKCPLHKFAKLHSDAGNNVWVYNFGQRAANNLWAEWMGVMHGDEIMYVFGQPLHDELGFSKGDKALSQKMMRLWANFAKTGNPNKESDDSGDFDESWPTFSRRRQEVYVLRNDTVDHSMTRIWDRSNLCTFWTDYLPNLDTQTANIDDAERKWKEEFHAWSTKYMVDWKAEFNHYMYTKKGNGDCYTQQESP